MAFAGISYLAIIVAAVASYIFGAVWYMTLSKPWMAALGKTEADIKGPDGKGSAAPFIIAFVAQLVMAYVLAGLIGHLGAGQVTPWNGLVSACLRLDRLRADDARRPITASRARSASLTVIDGLHWLGVLLIQGLVIGLFGV